MTKDEITHEIAELNLWRSGAKARIASLRKQEDAAATPEELAELRRARQSLENKNDAFAMEIKDLQAKLKKLPLWKSH
jgi:predicted  nucleic acid-binding Zn-ribbon protein